MTGRPAKIVVVSNGPLARNPRVHKEADTLGRAGHDVTVLTVRNHGPSEQLDRELMHTAAFRRELVEMLPGRPTERTRVFLRRFLVWTARKCVASLGASSAHALGPAGALLQRARRHDADLFIVHNEVAHWVGTRLLAAGRPVAADIEDWHSEDLLPSARATRPLKLIRSVERTLLHRCAYTTTTSNALADALHARYGGTRPAVLTNSFPLQNAPQSSSSLPGAPPAFFWFSQTIGPGRGLEEFLAAWGRTTQPSRLVVLGAASTDYLRHLLQPLPQARRKLVQHLPPVAPSDLPSRIAQHDIGLALEPCSPPNKDLTISNKILQYLNAGLAVVASNTAGQREVLSQRPDAGVLVDLGDTGTFAAQLDRLLGDREALARRQRVARELAEEVYCWEREAPRLLALVDSALQGNAVRS